MKYPVPFFFFLALAACGGLGKPRPESASYDFGLAQLPATTAWPAQLAVADVDAPTGLDSKAIRYRLAYREPARIYSYTLSQWTATPAELLTRRLRQAVGNQPLYGASCSLQIALDSFDHVFESERTSYGTIKLHATLTDHKRHAVIAQSAFTHVQPAPSQDAQGGVAALSMAADAALQEVIAWAADPSHPCTD